MGKKPENKTVKSVKVPFPIEAVYTESEAISQIFVHGDPDTPFLLAVVVPAVSGPALDVQGVRGAGC